MLTDADRVPLAARAWIADGVRGALVTADGTVDWYCPAGIDGTPALWRLLDPAGAAVRVGPVREGTGSGRRLPPASQRYARASLVVSTLLRTGDGRAVEVLDFLPWAGPSETPPGRIVRLVTAVAGPVDVEVEVLPGAGADGHRGGTGAVEVSSSGVAFGSLVVRGEIAFEAAPLGRDRPRWRAVRRLDSGESMVVTVDDRRSPAEPLSVDAARRLADSTLEAWESWAAPVVSEGPYAGAVLRSALLVRSLTGPGGGPVAAGTTSLPRRPGGERTADERAVWLRDAAVAARALAGTGLNEDAEAAESWLRSAVEGSSLPWPAALRPSGEARPELEERAWAGWRRSQPVVVGAAPGAPVDLDVHGDVALAVSASRRGPWGAGGPGPLSGAAPALATAADWVADHWEEPDAGVWEATGSLVRLVASTVQAWVALDATARRAVAANPFDLDAAGWRASAADVLRWLEAEAVEPRGALRRSGPAAGAPEDSDAALLRVAWQGPWPAGHPIVGATVERVIERQSSGLLLHRLSEGVDDGKPGADSPDLLASLWAVRALARLGRWEEAHERLEAVLGLAGSTGILATAADPVAGELLGNLPAAAVHLAVLEAAADLEAGPS